MISGFCLPPGKVSPPGYIPFSQKGSSAVLADHHLPERILLPGKAGDSLPLFSGKRPPVKSACYPPGPGVHPFRND